MQARIAWRHSRLTWGQQGLWFAAGLDPASAAAYTLVFAFEADGPIDVGLLDRGLAILQARHEVLRGHIALHEGFPALAVQAPGAAPLLRTEVLAAEVASCARDEARHPPRTSCAPLLRVTCACPPGANGHGLVFAVPHLVLDGPSADRLFDELSQVCGALARGQVPSRDGDDGAAQALAADEAAWLSGAEGRALVDAARARAVRARAPFAVHVGAAMGVGRARLLEFPIDADGLARVAACARARRASSAAVWLAAFELALCRERGIEDFLVTLPVSLRDGTIPESAVGYFTNLGVVHARVSRQADPAGLIDRAADDLIDALEARRVPYALVASRARTPGPVAGAVQAQVGFNHERLAVRPLVIGTRRLNRVEAAPRWAKDTIKLDIQETPESARGWLVADAAVFDEDALDRLAGALFDALETLIDAPRDTG